MKFVFFKNYLELYRGNEHLKEQISLLIFFTLTVAFIMIRDFNTMETLTNNIEPPAWIDLKKAELSKHVAPLKNREFILALTTGQRQFSSKFRTGMINTGTMHLVAISAFHAGIMVIIFNFIFRMLLFFIPLRQHSKNMILFFLKLTAAFFYFFITGGSIPTLRALSFILFLDMFFLNGTFPHPLTLFLFSITATAVIIPHSATSLSFIMSAICVATVLQIYKLLPASITVRLISVSVMINFALLPVYSAISGTLPLSAPIVNLLVIPVVSITVPFITAAQFSSLISVELSSFFLNIADTLIDPASFLILFFDGTAQRSLIPLIDPPFFIKILFTLSFFFSLYLRKKAKIAAITATFIFMQFFIFNFQTSPFIISRSEALFERAYCITYPGRSGRLVFDRYKFNPKFNPFLISRMEKAASLCGISAVISIHTAHFVPEEIQKKIRKNIRFSNVRFYSLSPDTAFPEYRNFLPSLLYHDPFQ